MKESTRFWVALLLVAFVVLMAMVVGCAGDGRVAPTVPPQGDPSAPPCYGRASALRQVRLHTQGFIFSFINMAKASNTPSATASAHTLGPWRTDSIGTDRLWILDGEGNYLAEIVAKDECGFTVATDQQQANARLIAAAPDLLSTCELILTKLKNMSSFEFACGGVNVLRNALSEVIEQATGNKVHLLDQLPTCTKCGIRPLRENHGGTAHELCEVCEKDRIEEMSRIYLHYSKHPEECCCDTYLGRKDCESPIHGVWWRINAIDLGERFHFYIRARDRQEAMDVGSEICQDNGEECISVTKVKEKIRI